jgi:hypothetical protein
LPATTARLRDGHTLVLASHRSVTGVGHVLRSQCGALRLRHFEATTPLLPLSLRARRPFAEIPADPLPPALIRGSHYWTGNERSLHLWHQAVAGRGGAYLGVGTDQNYVLAGWARSQFLVIVDFDQSVVDLHAVYRVFFEHAQTPAQFCECWSEAARELATALLQERLASTPELGRIVRAFRMAQPMVWDRLAHLRGLVDRQALRTFVEDAAQYDHLRRLFADGRVVVLRGDYNGDDTLLGVAHALRAAQLRLGVVYLSNVEQYLEYTPAFRRNFLALDVDDDAVVIRTLGWRVFGYAPGERYHYNVQAASGFADWMRHSTVRRLPELLRFRTKTAELGLSVLDCVPTRSAIGPLISP